MLGNAQDVKSWLSAAEESDIIVEAVSDLKDFTTTNTVAAALFDLVKRKPHILIIYTSGTWVCFDLI